MMTPDEHDAVAERRLIALRNIARIVAGAYEKFTPVETVEAIDSELDGLDLGEY